MIGTSSSVSSGLEPTRQRIAHWRERRPYRGAAMPAALWSAAVELARRHGLYITARTLRLDYGSLKKRLKAASPDGSSPAFVELPALVPLGLGPCVIEIEAAQGARMRIEVSGVTVADLVTLTQGAWSPER